ncbi:STY0301 family protein [Dyella acidiphila]|uniref:Uncharacterized protein n=1 Tax=Dyella acidiphila TaxID=2775866 RepID=A0ABR9G4X4_9GAMM|nr:STY0301 family protein [Dyella acidiphila]MBE1159105.1 hypothetical protein [Dyella acidiphila]
MWWSKWLAPALALGISATTFAAPPHRYACPPALVDGQVKHAFLNVEAYDGPPEQQAALMGAETKDGVKWEFERPGDIYLICGYSGTSKTITVHAAKVTACKGTASPLAAYCD